MCQNQSIDDSDAPLARDLRVIVRERLKAGDSDGAVRNFLTARYGQFVLLKPPFDGRTLLLWSSPFLALATGGLAILLGRRRAHAAAGVGGGTLSPAESTALSNLLSEGDNRGR